MTQALVIALAALATGVLVAAQWSFHRALQRKALDGLKSRHLQQQLNVKGKLEQARRQIAQLQQELAAARLELKQRRDRAASQAAAATSKEALSRQLDAAPARPRLPVDGFADTLPSLQFPHADELLMR